MPARRLSSSSSSSCERLILIDVTTNKIRHAPCWCRLRTPSRWDYNNKQGKKKGGGNFCSDRLSFATDIIVCKLEKKLARLGVKTLPYYSRVPIQPSEDPPPQAEGCTIFYVGSESLSLTNLLMTHSTSPVSFQVPLSPSLTLSFITSHHHHHHHTHKKGVFVWSENEDDKTRICTDEQVIDASICCCAESPWCGCVWYSSGHAWSRYVPKKNPPPPKKRN